jgi:CBS domain-containing protein
MSLNAANIMTRNVATVRPESTVAEVARVLSQRDISAVPVCDAEGHVLGMLSEGDLMRPFGQENALRRSWWLDLLAEGNKLAPAFLDYIRIDHRLAGDLVARPVVTAPEEASVGEIADLLARHHIKRVPILRDGKLVGIVSRGDIVRVMAHKLTAGEPI